jgi:cytochrome c553
VSKAIHTIASRRGDVRSWERRRQVLWITAVVIATALALVLLSRSAMAQTQRSVELTERAAALTPDIPAGKALFRQHCASCHGDRANGGPSTVIPSLAGQVSLYLIKQLVDMAEHGREVPEMHRVVSRKALTSPQAIRDVSAYLSRLPANRSPELGGGNDLAAGKRYYQGLCAFCHGQQGEGNESHATPAMRGQHYSYLIAQMRELNAMHRYSVDLAIVEALEGLPFDRVTAIADYMSRLPDGSLSEPIVHPLPPPAED